MQPVCLFFCLAWNPSCINEYSQQFTFFTAALRWLTISLRPKQGKLLVARSCCAWLLVALTHADASAFIVVQEVCRLCKDLDLATCLCTSDLFWQFVPLSLRLQEEWYLQAVYVLCVLCTAAGSLALICTFFGCLMMQAKTIELVCFMW